MAKSIAGDQDEHLRLIKGINKIGLWTLICREIKRFLNVYLQTIIAPVITTLLFYAIFALAFGGLQREVSGVPYMEFLAPGLIMMAMVQNAFANSSSSLVIAKIQGNIVDILMPPLSSLELLFAFIVGGVVRGLLVGTATFIAMSFFVEFNVNALWAILTFAVLGTVMLSSLGLCAGIWAEKFDHIASVTNFVVTPLAFLSGTFYSINNLPQSWRSIADYNPFFYMIDGFRYGFIGRSDTSEFIGIIVLLCFDFFLLALSYWMLHTGYKIKS
jgi:ABC-2 type transport system permease protein